MTGLVVGLSITVVFILVFVIFIAKKIANRVKLVQNQHVEFEAEFAKTERSIRAGARRANLY